MSDLSAQAHSAPEHNLHSMVVRDDGAYVHARVDLTREEICSLLREWARSDPKLMAAVRATVGTHFVTVHNGGGSMSECAQAQAVFGPYDAEGAEAVYRRMESDLDCGYDDEHHVCILDTSKASDPEEYLKSMAQ